MLLKSESETLRDYVRKTISCKLPFPHSVFALDLFLHPKVEELHNKMTKKGFELILNPILNLRAL